MVSGSGRSRFVGQGASHHRGHLLCALVDVDDGLQVLRHHGGVMVTQVGEAVDDVVVHTPVGAHIRRIDRRDRTDRERLGPGFGGRGLRRGDGECGAHRSGQEGNRGFHARRHHVKQLDVAEMNSWGRPDGAGVNHRRTPAAGSILARLTCMRETPRRCGAAAST